MKIYIAGKVTGRNWADVTMQFGAAQKIIEGKGHIAINPLEVVSEWYGREPRGYKFLDTPWQTCMRVCIAKMMECDALVVLPGWTTSKGAVAETQLAASIDMFVYDSLTQIPINR